MEQKARRKFEDIERDVKVVRACLANPKQRDLDTLVPQGEAKVADLHKKVSHLLLSAGKGAGVSVVGVTNTTTSTASSDNTVEGMLPSSEKLAQLLPPSAPQSQRR